MKRRTFLAGVLAVASLPRSLAAQTAPKVVRIGWLTAQQASSLTPYLEALRAALAELGYVEGRNLTIEFRFGDDEIERVPALAAELVRLPVDLIVAQGAAAFEVHKLGLAGLRSKRCAVHLRAAPYRVLPALGLLCRSHPQRREARRSADRAADEIRACPQCESCQDTGPRLPARAARARRRGDRVTAYGAGRQFAAVPNFKSEASRWGNGQFWPRTRSLLL